MAVQTRLSQTSRRASSPLAALVVSVAFLSSAEAGQPDRYAAHMAASLAAIKADTDAVLAKYCERDEIKDYRQRLALMDKAALAVIGRIGKVQSEALARMLGGKPTAKPAGARKPDTPSVSTSAGRIYSEFCGALAKPLLLPEMPGKDKALLQRYYAGSFAAAEQYIARLGATAIALKSEAKREVLELCAVLPMLGTPDSAWSTKEVDGLADWMTKRQSLKMLESFAVGIPRPLTALAFAERAASRAWTLARRRDYVAEIYHQRADAQRYAAARSWCGALIELAERARQPEQAMEARLQMVELHEKLGVPWAAAMEAKSAMDAYPESPAWGKAAMLRLKSLYAAGRFDDVNRYAQEYIADDRAKTYLPQIIYVSWVASRRVGSGDSAARLQKMFLERFPNHQLGADMHFASAMTALAAGDYREAARRLEIIEYRYPESRVAGKAATIQARLDASGQTGKGQ